MSGLSGIKPVKPFLESFPRAVAVRIDHMPAIVQLLSDLRFEFLPHQTDANLVASYFQITGAWKEPNVKPILLPGSAGPASVVLQGVPMFVMRGINALGSMIRPDSPAPAEPVPIESPSPARSGS